ncbi:MAG: hypothetical protein HY446_01165, partial [Candidatus Niyogibacteria bacterium]|nr:hypothetical protein [Candidatus Niyogibacteria bacterium]
YPVIIVNGNFILARDYYSRLGGLEFYRRASGEEVGEDVVRRGVVLSLVIDRLVSDELLKRGAGLEEAEKRVADAVAKDRENLENAAWKLYGWDIKEFEKFSLLPQARSDILAERLALEGVDAGDWLARKAVEAEVKIYFLPYRWELGNLFEK